MADSRTSQLREVLDTLSVDPDVKEERDYLVSVLRRLGYTDRQIQRELGVDLGVEDADEADDTAGERTIEVEYLDGHLDIKEFEPVYRASQDELVTQDDGGRRTEFSIGGSAPDEGDGPATFQILAPEDDVVDFEEDDGEEDLVAFQETPSPESMEWPESGRRAETATGQDEHEGDWPEWPEEREEQEEWLPEDGPIETEFQAVEPDEPPRRLRVTVVEADDREEALQKARDKGLEPVHAVPVSVERAGRQAQWEVREAPTDEPYTLGEYTLHKREVTRKDGGVTPLYFFSKNPPKSGEPVPLPEGYTVHENERTGLPYLKKE